ncbi:MAG TPA: thiamine pyrophosphate-binding protein, partial [Rubellimicrobium sp.]|nr:thiamine pyrophosphate-binding protein [Rubellimicrobium sp.]
PDYPALARAYGGYGELVTRTEDFAHAYHRASAWGTVAVIECRVDSEALTPGQTLAAARAQGERARG